jgi:hypothetical protein
MINPVCIEITEKRSAAQVSKVRNRITHAVVRENPANQFELLKLR